VKDLLLFARPPKPRLAPLDVSNVLRTTAALLGQDSSYAGVQITVSGTAAPVMADAELLKIVFLNLLVNSAQALQGRGRVAIDMMQADGVCALVFADTGPGIPVEVRDRLFTPFVTTKARGTGLGLATVKRLVEAHEGNISIESPDAGGTRITIRLPLAPADLWRAY
jgi:signal transduction histidine kinase